jgi:MOSC domain-containing protein
MRVSVTELWVYPVKSMRGSARERLRLTATGFEWDRQWMVVDSKGKFLSQRTHPQLARVVPEIERSMLRLEAPGLAALRVPLSAQGTPVPVSVWDDSCTGLDQGEEAAAWTSAAVGAPVRLIRVAPAMGRLASAQFAGPLRAPLNFPDGYPILVTNEASLEALNTQLPRPVPMGRFRPNLVLRGLPAWAEDRIDTLRLGAVTLRLVKPCLRCTIPSIDQLTGEPSTDPAPALKKLRFSKQLRGVMFGENAVIISGSGTEVECGAEVEVTYDT